MTLPRVTVVLAGARTPAAKPAASAEQVVGEHSEAPQRAPARPHVAAVRSAVSTAVHDAAVAVLRMPSAPKGLHSIEVNAKKAEQEYLSSRLAAGFRKLRTQSSVPDAVDVTGKLKVKLAKHLLQEHARARDVAGVIVKGDDPELELFEDCGPDFQRERFLVALRLQRLTVRTAIMRTALDTVNRLLGVQGTPPGVSSGGSSVAGNSTPSARVPSAPSTVDPIREMLGDRVGMGPLVERRKRPNFPKEAIAVLRRHFSVDKYPDAARKAVIALEAGIGVDQVSNWYINARGRLK